MDPLLSFWSLAAVAFGYLLGSVPFGLILTRMAGLGDVRAIGSGNIGATNVLRTGNKKLAAVTLALDMLKGTAAVLIAYWLAVSFNDGTTSTAMQQNFAVWMPAGVGAFLGHVYPVWLNFKGGKGVATYIGVLLGWWWQAALLFCGVWLVTAFLTRYSSLSAILAAIVTPLALYWHAHTDVTPTTDTIAAVLSGQILIMSYAAAALSGLLIWKHRENIGRLIAGEESRIGGTKADEDRNEGADGPGSETGAEDDKRAAGAKSE